MAEEIKKYMILARVKTSGGQAKGAVVLYEGRNFPRTLEAFALLSNAHRYGIISRGAYNLEMHEQVVLKETPYMVRSSHKLCSMRGDVMYWSEEGEKLKEA